MINNLSLNDYLLTHCNEIMEKALAAERHPAWQRSCPEMNDIDFCSGLIAPDTLIRDNNYQLLRCQNRTETNIQTVF